MFIIGGSLTTFLSKGLPKINTQWSKWKLFFCDERVVPENSTDSTFGAYKNSLIGAVPLTESQFIKINPNLSGNKVLLFNKLCMLVVCLYYLKKGQGVLVTDDLNLCHSIFNTIKYVLMCH